MNIQVNNKSLNVSDVLYVTELIELLGYRGTVAVFVNGSQLLLSQYKEYQIKDNDAVTIIKPLGGG